MQVFKIEKNSVFCEVKELGFKLEKDMQNLVEANLEKIFGLEFVCSEMSLNGFRLDSLAYDRVNKSFVIIEYKNGKSYSVIDQGYSYLALLLNNKADFVLTYNEELGKSLKRDEVDWGLTRVIFVSPNFTTYQKSSINFKDLPIELWEIKKFENETLILTQVKSQNSSENINVISNKNEDILKVSKEIKTYSEDEHLQNASQSIKELYETAKSEILNLGDVSLKATKHYIAFVVNKRNIVIFVVQKNKIKAYINLKFCAIKDEQNKVRDVSNIGSWGSNECEFTYDNLDDLDYLLYLVKQSYKNAL